MLYQLGCDLKLPVSFTKDGQREQPTLETRKKDSNYLLTSSSTLHPLLGTEKLQFNIHATYVAAMNLLWSAAMSKARRHVGCAEELEYE